MTIHKRSHTSESSFDPVNRFETSWLLSPLLLFILRTVFAVYAFTTIFTYFGYNDTHGMSASSGHSFSYFTNLTYWGLAFYFAFSAAHTGSYWLTGNPLLARWPRALQVAHSIYYSTIVVYPWLVTIVFWSLLYSRFYSAYEAWSNVSEHAFNSVFAFFEIVLPRTVPLPFLHIIPLVVILALYLGLAYLTHATEHFFVYDFLDNEKHSPGIVAGYIVGILVGAIIIFLIVRYLIVLRIWITEEKLGMSGIFTHRRGILRARSDAEHDMALQDIPAKHANV